AIAAVGRGEGEGLGVPNFRRVAVRLRRVPSVVERVLDGEMLRPEVGGGDAEREAATRAECAAAGGRRIRDGVERDDGAVPASTDERDVRLVDRQLLAVAAVAEE